MTYFFCPHTVTRRVQSASNRNYYQGISFGVKCSQRLELTTLPS